MLQFKVTFRLANKQDKEGALSKEKITERLHLDELADRHKFKFNVVSKITLFYDSIDDF